MAYAGPQFYSQHQQAPSHLDTSTLPGTENSMQGQYQHAGETAVNHDLSGDHFYSRPPHQLMAPHGQFERQVDMRPDGLSVDHGQQSVGAQQNGPNGIVLSLLATQLMNTVCGVGFADQPKVIPNQPNMIPNQPNMTPAQQPFSASLGTPIIASTATPHMMNMLTGSPDESHDISTYQSWPQRGLGQFTSMGSFDVPLQATEAPINSFPDMGPADIAAAITLTQTESSYHTYAPYTAETVMDRATNNTAQNLTRENATTLHVAPVESVRYLPVKAPNARMSRPTTHRRRVDAQHVGILRHVIRPTMLPKKHVKCIPNRPSIAARTICITMSHLRANATIATILAILDPALTPPARRVEPLTIPIKYSTFSNA
ncbi:hypothetical protein LTR50_004849 [Elasticomyces elasticus]|nr:hypothetical protein LTR50_004849 [Elasticomyces elasticus]